jgi:hypothetical protein
MHVGLRVKCLLLLSDLNERGKSTYFVKLPSVNFYYSLFLGSRVVIYEKTDRQVDVAK